MKALHTKIAQELVTKYGVLVRESYFGFPSSRSNIYMVGENDEIAWFAEKPMPQDLFANDVIELNEETVSCASWAGVTCEINLRNGSIIKSTLTK